MFSSWTKIKVDTTTEGLTHLADIFDSVGLSCIEIEDSEEFLEVLEQTKPQWDYVEDSLYEEKSRACSISAYVANTPTGEQIIEMLTQEVFYAKSNDTENIYGTLAVTTVPVFEEDWANSWKKYFKPIPVGENILICPVWEEVPDEYKSRVIFKIDPGMSFGTGTHETTRLCVEALEKHIKPGDLVLDIGCGSGILSIIAMILGAKSAVAVDIDENCVKIAQENATTNKVPPDNYKVYSGNMLFNKKLRNKISKQKYNIILINIIPDVIIPLLPFVKDLLEDNDNSRVILSGIISNYLNGLEDAVKSNRMRFVEKTSENDWHCVVVGK